MVFNGKYLKSVIIVLVVGTSGFLTIPNLCLLPGSGLDNSWVLALNIAAANKLQFGKDIVFTFGPFGFFWLPVFYDVKLWVLSLTVNLFVHLLFFYSVIIMMMKSRTTIEHYLFVSVVLLIATPISFIDYKLFVAIIILVYLTITGRFGDKPMPFILIFASLLMAMGSLIRFTALLISLSVFFFLFFFFIHKRQFKDFLYILLTYILSVLFLWIIAGQEIANLPAYLSNGYKVAHGYNATMSINGPMGQLYIGIFVIGLFVLMLFLSGLEGRFNVMIFILITSGFIFISFKHGFVRHDVHAYIFFGNMLLVLSFLYILHREDICILVRSLTLIAICILAAFSIFNKYQLVVMPDFSGKISAVKTALSLAANVSKQKEIINQTKDMMRKGYSLNQETLRYIHGKSVDIFPWETSLTYAYDLRWSPRPVFQSYSAYTARLDMLNARHFQGIDAPEILLYSLQSIDGRYPIFDEPATFKEVLCNYRAISKDGEFIILEKKKESRCLAEKTLSTYIADIGEPIEVPDYEGGYTLAKITLEYSLAGKIVGFFYKPSQAYIELATTSDRFRFVPDTARNGIFLSQYIGNTDDLYSVFSGNIDTENKIQEILIDVDKKWQYKKKVKIEFISTPAEVSIIKTTPQVEITPIWHKTKIVSGGLMIIDSVNNKLYGQLKEKTVINPDTDKFLKLSGWAVDDKKKDSGKGVYLVFRYGGEEIIIPTRRQSRPDVAKHFGVEGYMGSGWACRIKSDTFKKVCYTISVRILRADGKEYYELDGDKPICFETQ